MPERTNADDDLDAAFDGLAADLKAAVPPSVTRGALIDDLKAINRLAPWAGDGFFPVDETELMPSGVRPRATLPRQ